MYSDVLGIVGGFGGYATLEFYRCFLEEFSSECERNYSHIIFDNNFTMPSRTLALLYGNDRHEVVQGISDSIRNLISLDCTYIFLVCGPAHGFLEDIFKILPEAKNKIVNIIEVIGAELSANGINEAAVIAAEGALHADIYGIQLEKMGIKCKSPNEERYGLIRTFIESVKQNRISDQIMDDFVIFLDQVNSQNIILGCTEFPVLVNHISCNGSEENKEKLKKFRFFDPMTLIVKHLKKIMH